MYKITVYDSILIPKSVAITEEYVSELFAVLKEGYQVNNVEKDFIGLLNEGKSFVLTSNNETFDIKADMIVRALKEFFKLHPHRGELNSWEDVHEEDFVNLLLKESCKVESGC